MMTVAGLPRAFGVWFRQLDRFDPASFEHISWHWPKEVMAPISSILKLRKAKVDRGKFSFADLQPITIHFDGSVDKREVDHGRDYTMELFFAHPGDVVVAKIDLKNGAVGLVPEWENVIVTNHFAVYEPNLSKLVPEYFLRLIQASFFKAYLWRNKVGAEGRKEVKLEFFENIEIPLPTLDVQQAIVSRWQAAQKTAVDTEDRATQILSGSEEQILADLGLKPPALTKKPRFFTGYFQDFERWSVSHNQTRLIGIDIEQAKYPSVSLGNLLSKVQYGTSEKANERKVGIPVLRINNIKAGMIDVSNLKHIPLDDKTKQGLVLKDGDILIIRTSGSKGLVGTCAVFHEEREYVFASYLIRLRVDKAKANPDYISWFINSSIGRNQIDVLSRQIMQNNINSEELRSLRIPLPPLNVQQSMLEKIHANRIEITRQRQRAMQIRQEAEAEIEAMILGTKKV